MSMQLVIEIAIVKVISEIVKMTRQRKMLNRSKLRCIQGHYLADSDQIGINRPDTLKKRVA